MSQLDFFQGYLNQGMGNLMNGTSSEMACAKSKASSDVDRTLNFLKYEVGGTQKKSICL